MNLREPSIRLRCRGPHFQALIAATDLLRLRRLASGEPFEVESICCEPRTWYPPVHSRLDPRCRNARISLSATGTRVRGNLSPLKIYHVCRIEFGSNCLSLLFTTPGHLISLDSGLFQSPYHGVDLKNIHFFVHPPNNRGSICVAGTWCGFLTFFTPYGDFLPSGTIR